MKLSLVFELLLIFVLLAFAASKSVGKNKQKGIQNRNDSGSTVAVNEEKQDESSISTINKYCKCSEAFCNCCRDFAVPYIHLDGPGCASLMYLNGDKMSVSLSFGRKVITNKTISSRKPSPVCMPLPGGVSKFCGRVYNIARTGEEFRACLGLELQSKRTVEAAVRVSCFKFGPRGVHAEPADPLPLVPQDEKVDSDDDDDDEDDDDDDDDFGLGDDDDGDLDGINDVESADYTGFSLLSEDLLGDLFGSGSSGKKSNKNRKKQAPASSTTTTTKRPRTTRPRTTRRPNTRTTTPRTTRTTTVKVRPVNRRTRRPTRNPGRPNRRPTTSVTTSISENAILSSAATTAATTIAPPAANPSTAGITSTERSQFMSTANDDIYQPIVIVTQRPSSTLSLTTQKATTNFEDPGIEMSLAQLTGQLAAMPASPIVPEGAKDNGVMTSRPDLINYQKIETITPKGTTISFASTSDENVNEDMVQIVHSLDSNSEEQSSDKVKLPEKTRSYKYLVPVPIHYEGLSLPKRERQFRLEDLDVLDLTEIGQTVGDQLGIFGRKKRQNKVQTNNNKKPESESEEEDDDEDDDGSEFDVLGLEQIGETVGEQIGLFGRDKRRDKDQEANESNQKEDDYGDLALDAIGETLALDRSAKNTEIIKKGRRRQNKMMHGDWSKSSV